MALKEYIIRSEVEGKVNNILKDEGENCGFSIESKLSKKRRPGLRCDTRPNSDGESGTCVNAEGISC